MLEIRDLHVKFHTRQREAVAGVSLTIHDGEILGLVGESGSGKSVTAMSVAGLLPRKQCDFSGEILLDGAELLHADRTLLRQVQGREIGVVFQEPQSCMDPLMKIGPQVEETLRIHTQMPKEERHQRALAAMAAAELPDPEGVYRKYPHELSGGMLQRVGIAVAMLNDPKLLILDEPTAGLDPRERVRFRNLIHTLAEDRIVILSTHIVSDIETIAGQIVMFKDHRLYCCDSPARICARFQGRVFQLPAGTPLAPGQFLLSEGQGADGPVLRVLCETPPVNGTPVTPGLEDAFLAIYREEQT